MNRKDNIMFNTFKLAVQRQFLKMSQSTLYTVSLDKDVLWDVYLMSFPEGTNPIYKERTEHDCQCCKQFIRTIGNVVSIDENNNLVSIWDVVLDNFYQEVANELSFFVKNHQINNIFLHNEKKIGTDFNYQIFEDKPNISWTHFHVQLPGEFIKQDFESVLSDYRADKDVLLRSLLTISKDSLDIVLDLIDQNSLYRGEENKFALESFRNLKTEFAKVKNGKENTFCWSKIKTLPQSVTRIRNTSIGTLLQDLSEGKDLERSIAAFEAKVAPANYKRPTAPITKMMIEKAKQTINDLGLLSALDRRFAVPEDISITNVLFADGKAKTRIMDTVFDQLADNIPTNIKNLDKVEEVNIEDFIANILPKATSLELMFDNCHSGNLVSLIAPVDLTAKGMFKWNNNFSWSYNGEMADSIKERVKNAGGKVDGDLRCSLSWFNTDDLDLHMYEPDGTEIYFRNKNSYAGSLDVDMNAGGNLTNTPVENICYPNKNKMRAGVYRLVVNNYRKRENVNFGFDVEIEFDGIIHSISYGKSLKTDCSITVAQIDYNQRVGFTILESLPSSKTSKTIWNIPTQTFHKVSLVLLSPNHWNNKPVGNKHYFFMLDKCVNDDKARGFFNEFLSEELSAHRKVFEVVGSKMQVEKSDNQLSGLGFSSTQRNSILCKVTGSFTRIIKITF